MPTKTFSGRADVQKLAYADALAQCKHGMSYGRFCASILLDQVQATHALPDAANPDDARAKRVEARQRLRQMSERLRGSALATMSDKQIKAQVATRYE